MYTFAFVAAAFNLALSFLSWLLLNILKLSNLVLAMRV